MRILIAVPLLALAACNVTKDSGNDQVTIGYNQDLAENTIDDAANTAGNVAADVGNSLENAGNTIDNKVGDDDDSADGQANAAGNSY